jgi:hypothetical protein
MMGMLSAGESFSTAWAWVWTLVVTRIWVDLGWIVGGMVSLPFSAVIILLIGLLYLLKRFVEWLWPYKPDSESSSGGDITVEKGVR